MPVAVRPNTAQRKHSTTVNGTAVKKQRRSATGQFTVVESITRPTPKWLPGVIALQKVTRPISILALTSVLAVHGINVVLERQWGTKFRELETIQNRNKALTIFTERQKYQLPRNLEVADKGYVELKQDRVLFIQPESLRPPKPQKSEKRQSLLREDRLPVGY